MSRVCCLCDLACQFLNQSIAERANIFGYHDEGARPANDIAAIIFLQPLGWTGVLGIGGRDVGQDDEALDGDPFCRCFVPSHCNAAPGVVIAVARYVNGATARFEWRAFELSHRKIDRAANRGALGERFWRFANLISRPRSGKSRNGMATSAENPFSPVEGGAEMSNSGSHSALPPGSASVVSKTLATVPRFLHSAC